MTTNTKRDHAAPLILSLGSINADFQVRVDRRPDISETLIGTEFLRAGGGKAANVALIARRLGLPARLIGRVGQDDLADQALGCLKEAGVDLGLVARMPDRTTGVSMITVPPDGKKGIVLAPNANEVWDQPGIDAIGRAMEEAPRGSVLVLDSEIPQHVVESAAAAAGRCRLTRLLDPSPADEVSRKLLAQVDIVVPNPGEAKTLTGIEVEDASSALAAARTLLERGPSVVVVKLPDGGCVLAEPRRAARIESFAVKVVDTTGAGDAFAGAMAVALAEGRDAVEAARFATAASTIAVTRFGSQRAYPNREDLDAAVTKVGVKSIEQE